MKNLDEFKKKTIYRLIIMILSTFAPIIIVVVFSVVDFKFTEGSLYKKYAFIPPIMVAIFEIGLISYIVHLILLLVNENYRAKMDIKKHDERLIYLKMRSDAVVFKFCIYLLAVVTIVTLFTNIYHFILCISLFISFVLIKFFVYLYYLRNF